MDRADDDKAQRRVVDGHEQAVVHARLVGPEAVAMRPVGGGKRAVPSFKIDRIGKRHPPLARRDDGGKHILRHRRAHGFDQHPDRAAAGQPHSEGILIGNAIGQETRLAVRQRCLRLFHHRALDAAAGDGPHHLPRAGDNQLAADRPGGRPPGLDHRGKGRALAGAVPFEGDFRDAIVIGAGHGRVLRRPT